jgi:hypothetical protein
MTSQQLELIARRGLTLPEPTLTRLRTVGIWCEANLTVQRRDQDWLIRGQESGGAVNDIGRYVSFCKEDGTPLSWLQPVKNFMPNGLHAILLDRAPIVRLDMYRFETSYDLLITSHTLVNDEGTPKPKLETKMIFFHRFGVLERELWGKDKMFRGAVAPEFYMSNGSEARVPHVFQQAVFKMTEAVTCTKCKHQHLLEPPSPEISLPELESVRVSAAVA